MSKERFIRKLQENLTSLHLSNQAFDLGLDGEAIRIATALRVLFYSADNPGSKSVSILRHLRMETGEILSTPSQLTGNFLEFISIKINLASPNPITALPRMGTSFTTVNINDWWKTHPIHAHDGRKYTRYDLIRTAADQDGGAHVDSTLEAFYQDLEAGSGGLSLNGENLVYPPGRAPFDQSKIQRSKNIHLAMLRQFSHEVLTSAAHFRWVEKLKNNDI